jgi:hypothetical protein
MIKERDVIQKIRIGIDSGIYKCVRLSMKKGKNSNDVDVIVPFNLPNDPHGVEERLKYIIHKLDQVVEPGHYEITCASSFGRNAAKDFFPVTVLKREKLKIIPQNDKDNSETILNAEAMSEISLDEYIAVIKENAELKAQNTALLNQISDLQDELTKQPLSDPSAMAQNSTGDRILTSFDNALPTIANLIGKHYEQKDRLIGLKEKQLSQGKVSVKNKNVILEQRKKWNELADHLDELFEQNQDAFNNEMDSIQQSDPKLYDFLCNKLGIEEDDEGNYEDESDQQQTA